MQKRKIDFIILLVPSANILITIWKMKLYEEKGVLKKTIGLSYKQKTRLMLRDRFRRVLKYLIYVYLELNSGLKVNISPHDFSV
jgi:hypothetical protein